MKIDPRAAAGFLARPGSCRVILLHGDDGGLVRERGDALTRLVAGSLTDAFAVASLDRDTHDRLAEEVTALSLMGGRRVVRVRDPVDALLVALERALRTPSDTLVVLEAGAMQARSKLRTTLEARPDCAVIACYPEEGRDLQASLRAMVEEAGCRIAPDALAYLAEGLGADRAATRNEVEKLVLYVGEAGTIDIDAVEACVADASATSLDDALFAAMAGDVARADRAIERAIADGAAAVQIARALLLHLGRLRIARRAIETSGMSAADAVRNVRPPVFYKRTAAFTRALTIWNTASLARASAEANRVELACKQTGAPDLLLCRHLMSQVARQASRGPIPPEQNRERR